MQFLRPENEHKELTYNDVFLMPQYSDVRSRMDVDLSPVDKIGTTIPIVVANMTAVAGRRMAETVTRRGGLVVLPQDMSLERIAEIVKYVKARDHVIETPVVLSESESVQTALNLIHKRSHRAVIITDAENHPVGIFTEKDAWRHDRYRILKDVMVQDVITLSSKLTQKEMYSQLLERRISIAPVVNDDGSLIGVMTRKGAVRASMYKPALNAGGELLTCAAVRIRSDLEKTITQYKNIGVDVIVLDTAHGHQERMLDAIRKARQILGPDHTLVAGNIVTVQAAEAFIKAGASILKVGVGPGAACKTRMMTGVGRPQFSAVHRVARFARKHGVHVWADGGCKHPRDVVLALAAGASSAMVGTWFAGTYESPADVNRDEQGRFYKEQFGMASSRAVANRYNNEDSFEIQKRAIFDEGSSQSKMYLKSGSESVEDILDQITAGLRSACTYSGANDLRSFYEKAIVGVQTSSGYTEGKPVNQSW